MASRIQRGTRGYSAPFRAYVWGVDRLSRRVQRLGAGRPEKRSGPSPQRHDCSNRHRSLDCLFCPPRTLRRFRSRCQGPSQTARVTTRLRALLLEPTGAPPLLGSLRHGNQRRPTCLRRRIRSLDAYTVMATTSSTTLDTNEK